MKKIIALLLGLMMLTTVAFAEQAAAPTAEPAPTPVFVDAKIVSKVLDEGQVVAGVRLEWDLEFAAGALTTSSFAVNGYTIIGLYVNNDGVWKHAETSGKYVFLEFEDPTGIGTGTHNTLQFKDMMNLQRDLTIDVQSLYDMNLYSAKGFINYEVDDYLALSVTNNDYTTNYRLFVPAGWEDASLPLVIWLHGVGECGNNNLSQIAANRGALNFSDAEAQAAHPCFVLAPQANPILYANGAPFGSIDEMMSGGWDANALANIESIVTGLVSDYKVDPSRIYVAGCSLGGMGSKSLMYAYPDMIAASLITANSSFSYVEDEMKILSGIPVWLITSTDDMSFDPDAANAGEDAAKNVAFIEGLGYNITAFLDNDGLNGFLRGQDAVDDVQRVIDAAAAADSKMIISTYKVGTVLPAAHWSWMAATDNAAVRDWLFSQVNDAPYTGK